MESRRARSIFGGRSEAELNFRLLVGHSRLYHKKINTAIDTARQREPTEATIKIV
jgi:hypothetical protein